MAAFISSNDAMVQPSAQSLRAALDCLSKSKWAFSGAASSSSSRRSLASAMISSRVLTLRCALFRQSPDFSSRLTKIPMSSALETVRRFRVRCSRISSNSSGVFPFSRVDDFASRFAVEHLPARRFGLFHVDGAGCAV